MRHWIIALCATLLAACGGGGGGGGGGESSSPPVTLSPSTLSANARQGTSATLTVRATLNDPAAFGEGDIYVFIVDNEAVLTPQMNLSTVDATTIVDIPMAAHRSTPCWASVPALSMWTVDVAKSGNARPWRRRHTRTGRRRRSSDVTSTASSR